MKTLKKILKIASKIMFVLLVVAIPARYFLTGKLSIEIIASFILAVCAYIAYQLITQLCAQPEDKYGGANE